jgi:hypothetical protein
VGAKVGHFFVICKFLCTFVLKIDVKSKIKDGHNPFSSLKHADRSDSSGQQKHQQQSSYHTRAGKWR